MLFSSFPWNTPNLSAPQVSMELQVYLILNTRIKRRSMKVPITCPGRGRECRHLQCFDLSTFLNFNKDCAGAAWKCGVCNLPLKPCEFFGFCEGAGGLSLRLYRRPISATDSSRREAAGAGIGSKDGRLLGRLVAVTARMVDRCKEVVEHVTCAPSSYVSVSTCNSRGVLVVRSREYN